MSSLEPKKIGPAVWASCLLMLVALTDSQILAAITPRIAEGLQTSKTLVASSASIYAIAAACVALILARYAAKMSIPRYLPIAGLIFLVASGGAALAPNITIFLIARMLAGLAGGLISALAIAGIANASTYAQRGRQMSGVAISYFLAPVLGVPLGTLITSSYSWRTLFVLLAVVSIFATWIVYRWPLPNAPESLTPSLPRASLWQIFNQSRNTRLGVISAAFVSGGLVGFTTYLGTWLTDAFQTTTKQIGFVYALAGIVAVVGGAVGGRLADKVGKRSVAVTASRAMAVLLLIVPTFSYSPSLLIFIALTALAAALRIAPLQALISELVVPEQRATFIALRNSASQLGIAATVALGGRIYGHYGLFGVALLCAAASLIAAASTHRLQEPKTNVPATLPIKDLPMKRWYKPVITYILVLVLVITVGFPWLLSFLISKAGTRPDERQRHDTPANQGVNYQEVSFTSTDGHNLTGWYLPSTSKQITIIMTHGLFRSRYEMLDRAIAFNKAGYGVLLYDLRRHGQNGGEFSTLGLTESRDVLGALAFSRQTAPNNKMVLMGVSMGAAATLLAASQSKDLLAVVAESSFLSFEDVVRHHFDLRGIPQIPFATAFIAITEWRLGFSGSELDILATVPKINCPILFIGGTEDQRMPNGTVLEPLYQATRTTKSQYIVKATHGQAYSVAPTAYVKAVVDFLQVTNP